MRHSKLVKTTAPKALKMLKNINKNDFAEIEINDGAVCVGGRAALSIDHLNKYKNIIRDDEMYIWFDGINEVIREEKERETNIAKNHVNRIVRDLNELIENVFKFELGIKVLFSYVEEAKKPFILTIRFGGDLDGAEWGAEWIAETAHTKLMTYKDIYEKSVIDTYNYNENEEE